MHRLSGLHLRQTCVSATIVYNVRRLEIDGDEQQQDSKNNAEL